MTPKELMSMPKYEVIRAIKDYSYDIDEILRTFNIFTHMWDLNGDVSAFVFKSRKGRFHIVVNEWLSHETKQKVFLHELYHIVEDMPKKPYILGLDMHRHESEKAADKFYSIVSSFFAD